MCICVCVHIVVYFSPGNKSTDQPTEPQCHFFVPRPFLPFYCRVGQLGCQSTEIKIMVQLMLIDWLVDKSFGSYAVGQSAIASFTHHCGPAEPIIQTGVLGHLLVRSLAPHCSLTSLLCPARFACALCAHSLGRTSLPRSYRSLNRLLRPARCTRALCSAPLVRSLAPLTPELTGK